MRGGGGGERGVGPIFAKSNLTDTPPLTPGIALRLFPAVVKGSVSSSKAARLRNSTFIEAAGSEHHAKKADVEFFMNFSK